MANRLRMPAEMHEGAPMFLAGNDVSNTFPFIFSEFSFHDELSLLVKGGPSPLAALQSATINPANFLMREQRLGTVAEGKLADVVLLDANPLDDIDNTKRIAAVVLIGRYLSRTELNTWPDRAAAIARR